MSNAVDMMPIIADESFNRIAAIDDYISFIWSTRYYDTGDFQITIPASSSNTALCKANYYVMRDDRRDVGIIEDIGITVDINNQEVMQVSGRFLPSILARRIIAAQIQVSGTVANCVKALINANAISPSDSARRIPNLVYGTFTNASTNMEQQFTGKNLLEAIQGICKDYQCGYRVWLNASNQFEFALFDGVDRSYNQSTNPYVIFSTDYDNLESSDYDEDYSQIITDVLVAGEGEGTARKTAWARKQTLTGLARRELFVDARNASTNNGAISDSVYLAQLRQEGLEQISSFAQGFAGKVDFSNIEFGQDLGIGDIVTIENANWGISMNARLVEVIESMSEAGVYSVVPTFTPMLEQGELVDNNLYLLEQRGRTLMTQANDAMLLQGATFDSGSSQYASARKISELDDEPSLVDSHWLPIASANETYKLSYGNLKADLLDYEKLSNRPQIESVTLSGNKTFAALGLECLTNLEIENMLT